MMQVDTWSAVDLLPGATVVALGALLVWALRRWYDPLPRATVTAFAVVLATLFAPVLVGGKVLLPVGNLVHSAPYGNLPPPEPPSIGLQGDLVAQILPWQAQARRAVQAGRWPLWNDLAGAGMPLQGDPQAQAFQPLVVATYLLPLHQAPAVTASLRVLLALAGAFLLLRRQGLSETVATFGSVAWGCGGGVLLWLGWPMATSYALTPLALYAVARWHQVGGRRDFALLGVAVFTLLLGGHPETILYALTAVGLLLLGCLAERRRQGRQWVHLLRGAVGAMALAALAAAPVLLLVQRFLPETERYAATAFLREEVSVGELWRSLAQPEQLRAWGNKVESNLSPFVAPRARGSFEHGYWGPRNYFEDAAGFVGTGVLVFALAGLAPAARRFGQERLAQLAGGAALLLVLQPPGFDRLLGQLPVLGGTAAHQNHRLVGFVGLVIVCLAACELERWCGGERRWRALGASTAVIAGALVWAYYAQRRPGTEGAGLFLLEARWMGGQLATVTITLTVLAALVWAARRRPRWTAVTPWLIAAVTAAELLALHGATVRGGPARLFYPQTPPVRFLAENLGQQRFAGLGRVMPANFAQVHGLADLRVDGPSRATTYGHLLSVVQPPGPLPMPQMYWVHRPTHPLHDLLGVRYVLAAPGTRTTLPLVLRDPAGWVYERPAPLARLFLPASAEVAREEPWVHWVRRNRNFAMRALVPAVPPRPGGDAGARDATARAAKGDGRWRARRPRASTLDLTLPEPERLTADVHLVERRLLASSVLADPGWRLLVGGEPSPTIVANGPLVAAWLPRGEWRLELLYRPGGFLAACLFAAGAAGVATCGLTRPPRRR